MITTKTLVVGFAVVALLIVGCIIEHFFGDKRMARSQRANLIHTWFAAILASLILLFAIIGAHYAHARDRGQFAQSSPEVKAWFDGLRSGKGPCCSDADGTAISDADWESKDGHYRVRVPPSTIPGADNEPVWVDVPEDAVITEPNRVGRTMVWPLYGTMGLTIRCFMPGSMT